MTSPVAPAFCAAPVAPPLPSHALLDWLESRAGAQLGTEHPSASAFRTFGYRCQAVLAEFTDDELRVVRIYFARAGLVALIAARARIDLTSLCRTGALPPPLTL